LSSSAKSNGLSLAAQPPDLAYDVSLQCDVASMILTHWELSPDAAFRRPRETSQIRWGSQTTGWNSRRIRKRPTANERRAGADLSRIANYSDTSARWYDPHTSATNRLPSPQRGRGVWGWGGFHGDESAPRNHCSM